MTAVYGFYHNEKEISYLATFSSPYVPLVISLQKPAKPLDSDGQMPLCVLSIQERADQLALQFEGKPVKPQVTWTIDTDGWLQV